MSNLPSGTVTFLFTDIEGSTRLAREHPEIWEAARARHHSILREGIELNNGFVFQIIGDAFCAAFHKAVDAVKAAVKSQQDLQSEPWREVAICVRMGIHTGEAEAQGDEYRGYLTLSLIQRIMSAGHGGQILLSDATEKLLREELSKDTSLRDMGEHKFKDVPYPVRVFQVVAPGLQSEFPALRALDVFPNNLPTQLTSFVGREKEIIDVKQMLTNTRLLTLTGSGGTGKTRLSLQLALEILHSFKDGVWFIELAPMSDPALLPNIVANVLRVREEPGRQIMATLIDWLKDKESLFILDNCEHLTDACASFADAVLHACHGMRILASSREALGIAGETAYRVPSLPTPNPKEYLKLEQLEEYASVKLFIERAVQTLPTFKVTEVNAPVVAQICHRLDGIPLAIELAAARVKVLTVEQISERLDDRFRLLTGGSRTALPRQQTLRALIDWSYHLLSRQESLLFRRLAVFIGGWTLEAAEAVSGSDGLESVDILDLLTHLVDKSLVVVETIGEESRYRRLETIRQYAREKLFDTDETAPMRDRHLVYFLQLTEHAEKELQGREQKKWLARLEMEHDNLRAALEWSLKSQPEFGLRMAVALMEFWDTHGHITEARKWLEAMLKATYPLPPTPARVKAIFGTMWLALRQSEMESIQLLDEGLGLAQALGYKKGVAQGLAYRGRIKELFENDLDHAEALYNESLDIWRELDDKLGTGQALGPLASCALNRHDYARAESLFNESLSLFREVRNEREIAGALWNLSEVAIYRRDYDSARALAEESLALYRELEDKHGIATALRALSVVIHNQGNIDQAQAASEQSVAIFREIGDLGCLGLSLSALARQIHAKNDLQHAAQFAREAVTFLHQMGDKVSESSALDVLGRISLAQENSTQARQYFRDGLILQRDLKDTRMVPSLLEGLANVFATSSRVHDAILLLGAVDALREKIRLAMLQVEQPEYNRALFQLRAQIDDASFQKIWDEGRVLAMEQAIDLALKTVEEME